MNKDENQKRDLGLFFELYQELKGLSCEFGDKPDLIITTNDNKRLGVEHTRLYVEQSDLPSGRQLRPQERIQFHITQRAFEIFRDKLAIPLYLTVDFAEPFNYRTQDVENVAAALSLAVQHSFALNQPALSQGQDVWVYPYDFQLFGLPYPPGVASFHYKVVPPDRGFELWGPVASYFVPHLSISDVESVIVKKEKLLESYLTRCDNCWLLIATDAGWRSSHFDVPTEVTDHRYTTRFEKVFIMTITHRTLKQLTRCV